MNNEYNFLRIALMCLLMYIIYNHVTASQMHACLSPVNYDVDFRTVLCYSAKNREGRTTFLLTVIGHMKQFLAIID